MPQRSGGGVLLQKSPVQLALQEDRTRKLREWQSMQRTLRSPGQVIPLAAHLTRPANNSCGKIGAREG
jgi:hypothetical protein